MMYLFRNCSSLLSLDLSNWNTEKVVTFTAVFNGCSSLSELDLSSFDTSSSNSYYMMFFNCPSLISLNISNFGKNGTTSAYSMFDANSGNLYSITVGKYSPFKPDNSGLPEHPETGSTTKGWIGINSKHSFSSTKEFVTTYNGSYADTYVWTTQLLVSYKNTLGNTIHKDNKVIGYLGAPYDTTTNDLLLDIPDYYLDEGSFPENARGTFGEELQTSYFLC